MKRYLTAAGALAGATALIASSLLVTATAAHAESSGTLVVNIVDQYGRPTTGGVEVFDTDGHSYDPDSASGPYEYPAGVSQTFTLPSGGYAIESITPWSGITCAGITPCGGSSTPTYTAATTVADGAQTTYTMHVTVPTITGSTTVGNPLMIHLPDSLTNTASSSYGYYGYYFGLGNVTQQWMRGTTDIQGATSTSYTTVRADGSQTLSARLSPSLGESLIFAEAFGMQVEPFTTNAITMNPVAKYTTRAKLKLPKALHTDEPASIKVKVKAKQDTPAGFVTLKIGKYKAKKALQNGSVFFTLPHLTAGRYKVAATFHGTADFAAAKAKAKHLSVR